MMRRWGMVDLKWNNMKPSSQRNASGSPTRESQPITRKSSTVPVDLLVPSDLSEHAAFAHNGAFLHLGRRYTPGD